MATADAWAKWKCLLYVELNMVRCGVVQHPADWAWSGYGEWMNWRRRNRFLDIQKLLWLLRCSTVEEFRLHFNAALEHAILNHELERQAIWTEAIAIGERAFVETIEQRSSGGSG
jgi:putative transposase